MAKECLKGRLTTEAPTVTFKLDIEKILRSCELGAFALLVRANGIPTEMNWVDKSLISYNWFSVLVSSFFYYFFPGDGGVE